jgi:hypothetical protein
MRSCGAFIASVNRAAGWRRSISSVARLNSALHSRLLFVDEPPVDAGENANPPDMELIALARDADESVTIAPPGFIPNSLSSGQLREFLMLRPVYRYIRSITRFDVGNGPAIVLL